MTLVLAFWTFVFGSVALWSVLKRRPSLSRGNVASILLVRPCAGAEATLERALASTAEVRASAKLIVRFAVASERDPAAPVAERVAADLRERGFDAALVVTHADAPNAKAAQLATVLDQTPGELLVVADSDVDLAGVNLDDLVVDGVAATWAPPIEVSPKTLADRASAALLDTSMHTFALLGALDPAGLVGKLSALRRADLEAIGGFRALRRHLGEDMELARRLLAAGRRIACIPVAARSLAGGREAATVVGRYARWMAVIRAQRPLLLLTYPSVIAPFPALVAGALALGGNAGTALVVCSALVRLGVAVAARRRSGSRRESSLWVDAALADVLLWAAFVRALFTTRIEWRGTKLRILPGGEIGRAA